MQLKDEEVVQILSMICQSVVGAKCTQVDALAEHTATTIAACIHITGAWQGAVVVCAPQAFTQRAAIAMFSTDAATCTITDMQDALAEMTNMVGGNYKGMLPLTDTCQLSLPSVVAGADYLARVPGSRVVHRVVVDCDGHTLMINVLEKQAIAHAA